MNKYIALFFFVSFFLFGCKANRAPAGIIGHDRMISLLTEIHLADGRMYNIPQVPDSLYKYGRGRYMAIFKKYKTDSTQFRKSLQYYAVNSVELLAMYDQVMQNFKQKTDSINKVIQAQNHALPKK